MLLDKLAIAQEKLRLEEENNTLRCGARAHHTLTQPPCPTPDSCNYHPHPPTHPSTHRSVLKQYLDGIAVTEDCVDHDNPLLIVNGRVNLLPDAKAAQQAQAQTIQVTRLVIIA